MKTIKDINLSEWFITRELKIIPEHFVEASTPASTLGKQWIKESLSGRYVYVLHGHVHKVALEDPKELVLYELMWG